MVTAETETFSLFKKLLIELDEKTFPTLSNKNDMSLFKILISRIEYLSIKSL